jgi:ABC-type transport system substrate-binding protein
MKGLHMDPLKLREKAEKLLAKARHEEKKQKDNLNKKLSNIILVNIKNNGYNFDTDFAELVKKTIESSGIIINQNNQV